MDEFIELNENLLEDLIFAIQSIFPFVLYKINEVNEEGKEPELEKIVKEIEITDTDLKCEIESDSDDHWELLTDKND